MSHTPRPKRYGRALRRLYNKDTNSINRAVAKQLEKDGFVIILGEAPPPLVRNGKEGGNNLLVELTEKGREAAIFSFLGDNPYKETGELK